jgi:transcriptional regulator with XRE-family HTH domain
MTTTTHGSNWIDPIGPSAEDEARDAAQRDPDLASALERIAPCEAIARKVIIGRTMKDLTQKELAALVGTSHSQISRIESGTHLPDTRTLIALGHALGVQFSLPDDVRAEALPVQQRRQPASWSSPSVSTAPMSASDQSRRSGR